MIFHRDADPALRKALDPLIALRRQQAGDYFQEYSGDEGYQPGEEVLTFLTRHGTALGPADPEAVPYYLLLVGGPEEIPYAFQRDLNGPYAVGRLALSSVAGYAAYARAVVAAEEGTPKLERRATFFGVANPDDVATIQSRHYLAQPLAEDLTRRRPDWAIDSVMDDEAHRQRLIRLFGDEAPALLFTASHGIGFDCGDSLQEARQGALLCSDWRGPKQSPGPVSEEAYVCAADVPREGFAGRIAFHFACFGAGTPASDAFERGSATKSLAPRPFVARLPQRLLEEGGALAVVGHIERAWGYSFLWEGVPRQTQAFRAALHLLMQGAPVGWAMDSFAQRAAALGRVLLPKIQEQQRGGEVDSTLLAALWIASTDTALYAVMGDPAVRLPLQPQTRCRMPAETSTPEIHALIVGINFYLPQRTKEAPVYPSLGGCVHDALGVRNVLLDLGTPAKNIELLTATETIKTEDEPEESPQHRPTYTNLVAALERLTGKAGPGRQIVIHYSGHGGVARTQSPDKRDLGLGTDECLVPLDIGAGPHVPYLRDWELGVFLRRMVDAGSFVTLLLDCCHSGGLLRSDLDPTRPRPRGSAEVDATERPPSVLLEGAAVEEVTRTVQGAVARGGKAGLWGGGGQGYALLAACGPQQQAMEAAFAGQQSSGAMTHWLLDALRSGGDGLNYRELHQRLLGRIRSQFPTQTPMLEGEVDRRFLGLEKVPVLHGAGVLRGEDHPEGLLLEAGSLHAVGKGARFAIYPAGLRSEAEMEAAKPVLVRLTEVRPDKSPAEVVEAEVQDSQREEAPRHRVAVGDRAILLDAGDVTLRRPVHLIPPQDMRLWDLWQIRREDLRGYLAAEETQFVRLEEGDGTAEGYEVSLDSRGRYCISAGGGAPLPDVPATEQASTVGEYLNHLARFSNVHALRNTGRGTPLQNKVQVRVWRRPPDWPEGDFTPPPKGGLPETVAVDDYLYFEITNQSEKELHVAILNLQPGWSIEQLYPASAYGGGPFEVVAPGEPLKTWTQIYLPSPFEQPMDTFKVVASVNDFDLRSVELPALGKVYRFRDGLRGSPGSLQGFVESMAAAPPTLRHARPPKPAEQWVVHQVQVGITGGGGP